MHKQASHIPSFDLSRDRRVPSAALVEVEHEREREALAWLDRQVAKHLRWVQLPLFEETA